MRGGRVSGGAVQFTPLRSLRSRPPGEGNGDRGTDRRSHFARNDPNVISGELVLWRDGLARPAHSSVTRARVKRITLPSPCLPPPCQLTRATSLTSSLTYIERSAANGRSA